MKSFYRNLILAILSAVLLTLSFPKYDIESLAWIGLIPLILLAGRNSLKNAFLWCWVSGILFFLFTIYWLIMTINNYGDVPAWISALILLLLSVYLGLYFGIFGFLTAYVTKKLRLPLPFFAPVLWVTLEYIRTYMITGFPWASLGYSQYKFLHIIQLADITSVLGISFLIVGVNAAFAEIYLILKNKSSISCKSSFISIFFTFLLFFLSLIYGYNKLHTDFSRDRDPINVAVLQGNIPQHLKWNREFQRKTIDIYKRLTDEANVHGANLIIWPETAAPFFFQERTVYQKELLDLSNKNNTYILFGSPSYTLSGNSDLRLFNSAYLISPSGEEPSRYDKIHLVPFGEYVPLSKILFFIEKMVVAIGDFMPGKEYTVLKTPQIKFGVVICFEVIFPDLVRKFVKNGAEFMTTITNDAWFGNTSAPYQHFTMTVFRAVENRVYFARAANTGISGFISPKGEILAQTPVFTGGNLVHKISPSTVKTFYTLYGDVFAYTCIMSTGLILLMSIKLSLKNTHTRKRVPEGRTKI